MTSRPGSWATLSRVTNVHSGRCCSTRDPLPDGQPDPAFKLYVQEEAREYEKEFPDQLYTEWYRLYKLPKPQKNKPWKFKHLTVEHVYESLAKSNGKVYQLTQAVRSASNERWKRLHQFLSEIGVKALRTQLGQTLGIAQVSDTAEQYEANIRRVFGGQGDLFRH
jgi:hypothetical protein